MQDRYRVCLANDVMTAIHQIENAEFKIILLDMKLPDGDGSQVFRAAIENAPATQVIIITGCDVETDQKIHQVLAQGAKTVLRKPLDLPTLLAMMQESAGGMRVDGPFTLRW